MRDLLGNALIAESGVTELHLEDGRDDFLFRVLTTGLAPGSGGGEKAAIFSIVALGDPGLQFINYGAYGALAGGVAGFLGTAPACPG